MRKNINREGAKNEYIIYELIKQLKNDDDINLEPEEKEFIADSVYMTLSY